MIQRAATMSECGRYRLDLTRSWPDMHATEGRVCFVMLNPSQADGHVDDPTVRRVIRYAKDWSFRELVVVNLFAWRSSKPTELFDAADPRGPGNVAVVREHVESAALVVAAWGAFVERLTDKGIPRLGIEVWARNAHVPLRCLGRTKHGHPRHPLYQRRDANLVPFGPFEARDG